MDLFFYLESSSGFFIFSVVLLGLIVGSFLNVVIYRLPVMLEADWSRQCSELAGNELPETSKFNLVTPASACPACGHRIRAWENIPVISYLLLKGRCAGCDQAIPLRYPGIELATALLSGVTAWHYGFTLQAAAALLFVWALIPLCVIDYDRQLLPDSITLPMLWLGLLLSLFSIFVDTHTSIIGALAGYLSLWLVYHIFRLVTGKEGMGYGDFKLLAMIGAWAGWQSLPVVILCSSLVGAVTGIALIVFQGRERSQPIPFGPFLAAAGWITLLWGQTIIETYLNRFPA